VKITVPACFNGGVKEGDQILLPYIKVNYSAPSVDTTARRTPPLLRTPNIFEKRLVHIYLHNNAHMVPGPFHDLCNLDTSQLKTAFVLNRERFYCSFTEQSRYCAFPS
jgi:hypothetical protein